MKKIAIFALSSILVAGLFTGCRRNVATETTMPTMMPTQATQATTATTRPTEATRPATSAPTQPTHGTTMPHGTTDSTSGSETQGRAQHSRPRY